jgi:anaerobic dimethyl sulfoxide reductase subunit B (iron-sulfur subunit)
MSISAFYFDGTRCTGCKTCVFACKDKKDLDVGFAYRKVYEYGGGETIVDENGCFVTDCFAYTVSLSCNHCDNPICVMVCPTAAMHKDEETELVVVDTHVCVGCGYCALACPYNAPRIDREKGHSVKCDGCIDLVKVGELPVCVTACPARALEFGAAQSLRGKGVRASIAPLPASDYTTPNLFIRPSKDARQSGSVEGRLVNPLEVQ